MILIRPATVRVLRTFAGLTVFLLLIVSASAMYAQCPSADDDADDSAYPMTKFPDTKKPPPLEEPILPEAGFLSETHYTSQFFGFSMDLPLTVQGHEIMLPVMPEREHALLSLQFEKGQQKGYISITAVDPKPGLDVKTPEQQQQQQLRIWAQNGGPMGLPPQMPIPEYMLHSGHWYYSLRHKNEVFAAQYWTAINNYVVKVVINTNDKDFLGKAKAAMADVHFYCPQDDGTLTTTKGKPVQVVGEPYQGPTVPTFRVNKALNEQPGKTIPLGEVHTGVYRNADIGLEYTLPEGWQALPPNRSNPPPDDSSREYQFLHACSQTLLRAVPQPPPGKSYVDGPMIVLHALDYNCLSMRTAVTLADKRGLDETAATLEELGEFGQINTDQLRTISDHLFMVFHGFYDTASRTEDLSQRLSQTIYATRFNKLLLVWSLLAPTSSELEHIPTGGIVLSGGTPIQLQQSLRAKN
jgi:hypothetical protein